MTIKRHPEVPNDVFALLRSLIGCPVLIDEPSIKGRICEIIFSYENQVLFKVKCWIGAEVNYYVCPAEEISFINGSDRISIVN